MELFEILLVIEGFRYNYWTKRKRYWQFIELQAFMFIPLLGRNQNQKDFHLALNDFIIDNSALDRQAEDKHIIEAL